MAQWNEIRNGRLAMVAFLGFVAQHAATGKVTYFNASLLATHAPVSLEHAHMYI